MAVRARAARRHPAARAGRCGPTTPRRWSCRRATPAETDDRRGVAFEHALRRRRSGLPDGDAAVLAAGDDAAVGDERDRVHGAFVEAQHLLAPRCASSDQRMAEVSKLPETAVVPSAEIASARTGPPWPRNCACAGCTSSAANNANTDSRNRRGGATRSPCPGGGGSRPRERSERRRRGGVSLLPVHPTPARDFVARRPSPSRAG